VGAAQGKLLHLQPPIRLLSQIFDHTKLSVHCIHYEFGSEDDRSNPANHRAEFLAPPKLPLASCRLFDVRVLGIDVETESCVYGEDDCDEARREDAP
jgi:hypothetical protein